MKYSVFAFFPLYDFQKHNKISDQVVIVPEMLKYKDNIMNKE